MIVECYLEYKVLFRRKNGKHRFENIHIEY